MGNRSCRRRNRSDENLNTYQEQRSNDPPFERKGSGRNNHKSNSNFSNHNPFQRTPYRRGGGGRRRNSNSDDGNELFPHHHNTGRRNQPFSPNDQRAFVLRSQDLKKYFLRTMKDMLGRIETWYPDEVVGADEMDWQPEVEVVLLLPQMEPSAVYTCVLPESKGMERKNGYVWDEQVREFREQQRFMLENGAKGMGLGMKEGVWLRPRACSVGDADRDGDFSFVPARRGDVSGIRYPNQAEIG